MQLDELEQNWKKDFSKTLKNLKRLVETNETCPLEEEFSKLAKWIVETDISTYEFLPNHYANVKSNPFDLEMLLLELHHAMVDDGDVAFVKMKVNDNVEKIKMIFINQWDDRFRDICLKENNDIIRIIMDHNKRMFEFTNNLQKQGKAVKVPKLLTFEDIVFEAHNDPKQFVADVEDLVRKDKERIMELEAKKKELLGKLNF